MKNGRREEEMGFLQSGIFHYNYLAMLLLNHYGSVCWSCDFIAGKGTKSTCVQTLQKRVSYILLSVLVLVVHSTAVNINTITVHLELE